MKGDNGSYIKITVKGSMIENIVQTNQIFFTFSENRMSTLPSENSLEDAYNRSFWMVCVLSVCVCAGLWLCVFTCLYLMMGQGDILHKIAPPRISSLSEHAAKTVQNFVVQATQLFKQGCVFIFKYE